LKIETSWDRQAPQEGPEGGCRSVERPIGVSCSFLNSLSSWNLRKTTLGRIETPNLLIFGCQQSILEVRNRKFSHPPTVTLPQIPKDGFEFKQMVNDAVWTEKLSMNL